MAYQKLQQTRAKDVVKSDTVDITTPSAEGGLSVEPCVLYTGSGGIIRVLTAGGDDVTLVSVPAGVVLPIQIVRVFSSTTNATGMVALW
jgi:hypothetical protein